MEIKLPVTTLLSLYDPDSIGVRTLSTFVKDKTGMQVNQIFFKNLFSANFPYTRNELAALINLIKDLKTEILGVSIRSSSYKIAKIIIEQVRKNCQDIIIVIGGTHATIFPEQCIELSDIVCIGEGEYPFLNLIRNYSYGLSQIKNTSGLWVKINGQVFKNPINSSIDINELPPIDYSDRNKWYIEDDMITEGEPIGESSIGEIFSSRGCPFKCTYCTNSTLKTILNEKNFVRLKSVDNVLIDIANLRKYLKNLKKLVFADEVFAFDKNWTIEFCRKYKSAVGLPFAAFFYPNMITEETMLMLKDAGLTHGRVGLQSGSEHIRRNLYKRNHSNEKTVELANMFHKVGIRLTFDIIVNNPYETEGDLRETLKFYLQIPKPFELTMSSLVYFPKTELTNMALRDGFIKSKDVEGEADEALRLTHVLLKNKKMIYGYKNNLFWNSLFSLTSKSFIPKKIIVYLSNSKFLFKKPVYLLYFAKLANLISIGIVGLYMFKNKEIGFKEIFQAVKGFKFTASVNK